MTNHPPFVDEKLIAAYVVENAEYYIKKFNLIKAGNNYTGFNIPALLVPLLWLTYRRLYLYAFLFFIVKNGIFPAIVYLLFQIDSIQHSPEYVWVLIPYSIHLMLHIIVSIHANKIYLLRANKRIAALIETTSDETDLINAAMKSGSVSNNACFLLVLVLLIVNFFPLYDQFI